MKLSKEYIINRLESGTSVHDLATEIATELSKKYPPEMVEMEATIVKFEKMIQPLAPTTVKATDLARSMGIEVV